MSKKVLAIYYTQSGQLTDIVENFISPLTNSGISVETVRFKPKQDFAFPWNSERFFDAMPESVLGQAEFKKIVKNTPVITLIGSRNMWINAQERVKKALVASDAKSVGNVTL